MSTRAQRRWTAALLAAGLCLAAPAHGKDESPSPPVETDRWLELDLYRFDRSAIDGSARAFWGSLAPLFEDVSGTRGVILNVGWLVDPILEWGGDLEAAIPAPDPASVEIGSWGRMALWTYADLARLVGKLRQTAAERYGLQGVKVGIVVRGHGSLPGERPHFEVRHPEAFLPVPGGGRVFDPGARLEADIRRYGAYPAGVPRDLTAGELFGAQWGSLSRAVGLDAVVLRDGMLLGGQHRRTGPLPPVATAETWSRAVADLVRHTKEANPRALVMGHASPTSAIADWQVDLVDLEAIARSGHLDAFIDETRGSPGQLAHVLLRAAILSGTPTRHYVLTEPRDSSASPTAPDGLRWRIWASHHAAVRRPDGLQMPAGTYVSWGPGGAPVLSDEDLRFLTETLNDAIRDARATREVCGPTLVYNRASSEWLMQTAPGRDIGQWIDDAMGAVMEWPVPILSAARLEDLPRLDLELPILQTPVQIGAPERAALLDRMAAGRPLAIVGSPAGGIDPAVARLAGLESAEQGRGAPRRQGAVLTPVPGVTDGLPEVFDLFQPLSPNVAGATATVVHAVEGSPTLVLSLDDGRRTLVWDPPDLEGGPAARGALTANGVPWVTVARALSLWLRDGDSPWVERIELDQPASLSAWRLADGSARLLLGDLEDRARPAQRLEISLPASWLGGGAEVRDVWSAATIVPHDGRLAITLEPAGSRLLAVE